MNQKYLYFLFFHRFALHRIMLVITLNRQAIKNVVFQTTSPLSYGLRFPLPRNNFTHILLSQTSSFNRNLGSISPISGIRYNSSNISEAKNGTYHSSEVNMPSEAEIASFFESGSIAWYDYSKVIHYLYCQGYFGSLINLEKYLDKINARRYDFAWFQSAQ